MKANQKQILLCLVHWEAIHGDITAINLRLRRLGTLPQTETYGLHLQGQNEATSEGMAF